MSSSSLTPMGVTAVMLPELDFAQQIELCRALGVTHYVYRPRVIPDEAREQPYGNWGNHKFDLTPQRLLDEGPALRKQLEDAGLVPFGTVPAVTADADDAVLSLHFAGAAAAGAKSVRVGPLAYPHELFDYPAWLAQTIAHYRRAVKLASEHGVKVVIEMHCNAGACSPGLALNIVRDFDPAELGLILDLPNAALEGTVNAYLTVSAVRDWIDHCHVGGARRTLGEYHADGYREAGRQMCALADSDLYIPQWVGLVRQLGRVVPMVIEDYTANMPGELRLRNTAAALSKLLESD